MSLFIGHQVNGSSWVWRKAYLTQPPSIVIYQSLIKVLWGIRTDQSRADMPPSARTKAYYHMEKDPRDAQLHGICLSLENEEVLLIIFITNWKEKKNFFGDVKIKEIFDFFFWVWCCSKAKKKQILSPLCYN